MYTQAVLGSLLLKSISLHNNITYFYGNLYCVTVTYYSIINVASNNFTDYICPPPPPKLPPSCVPVESLTFPKVNIDIAFNH